MRRDASAAGAGPGAGALVPGRRPFPQWVRRLAAGLAVASVTAASWPATPSEATAQAPGQVVTERVSVSSEGIGGTNQSDINAISADGRFVAFVSLAENLVPGDTNGVADVFVHDRATRKTTRVNVASDGTQANGRSEDSVAISADGRVVAFSSEATNLAPRPGGASDVYVHDRLTGKTTPVSVASDGTPARPGARSGNPSLSADGRLVAFESTASLVPEDVNPRADVYVHDRETGRTELISVGVNGTPAVGFGSTQPSMSADGRLVAFESNASNLVVGTVPQPSMGGTNAFVRDRATGQTVQVNVRNEPLSLPGSGDLPRGTAPGEVTLWTGDQLPPVARVPVISADGRVVAFVSRGPLVPEDTNRESDLYVRDLVAGVTRLVSTTPDGTLGDRGVSGSPHHGRPSLSADGSTVAYTSFATNLVPDDTNDGFDVFVAELTPSGFPAVESLRRASVSTDGAQAIHLSDESARFGPSPSSGHPSLSADGATVSFASTASNLAPGDGFPGFDVFVRGPAIEGAAPPPEAFPPFRTPVVPPPAPATLVPADGTVKLEPGVATDIEYRLDLPRRPSPVDVVLVVSSNHEMMHSLDALGRELQSVVDAVAATGIDAHYGMATFWDWMRRVPGARYARNHDVGPPDEAFAAAVRAVPFEIRDRLDSTVLPWLRLPPHYTALHQAATGSGIANPSQGHPVPPGQAMTLRPQRRAFVLASDEDRLHVDPDGPSPFDTVAALDRAGVFHVGLNLRRSTSYTDNQATQGPMMAELSRETGAVAPAGGVDCDNDGRADIAEGEALVCDLATDGVPELSDRYAPAFANLLRALPDDAEVRLVVTDDDGFDVGVSPEVVEGVDLRIDHVGENALAFTVTSSCTQAQDGTTALARFAALVGGAEVATAAARLVCGTPAVEEPPPGEEAPPLAGHGPTPQPHPQPQPQPQSQSQAQPQLQPQPGPSAAAAPPQVPLAVLAAPAAPSPPSGAAVAPSPLPPPAPLVLPAAVPAPAPAPAPSPAAAPAGGLAPSPGTAPSGAMAAAPERREQAARAYASAPATLRRLEATDLGARPGRGMPPATFAGAVATSLAALLAARRRQRPPSPVTALAGAQRRGRR
jgi:Tol biopolymer transport system component